MIGRLTLERLFPDTVERLGADEDVMKQVGL